MYRLRSRTTIAIVGAVGVLALTVGCATSRVARQGKDAARKLNWDGAVYYYLEALARDPQNVEYRMALERARQKGAQEHFKRGMALKDAGRLVAAQNEFQMAVQLDPTHQYAAQELAKVKHDIDILSRPHGKETLAQMKAKAAEAKVKPPLLNPRSDEPITLSFPKPKSVKEIYRAMGKAYGFNVLFDPKLKDDKLSIELKDVTAEQALEIVMQAAGHFYKVLDEHTIIVADDTPQNRRDYEDLVIKTFFLSNADVKDVDKMLRSLIEARRIATNEQLNAITLRDTADKVAIAEKLIDTNDKAKAEVMVDVELMEVNSTKLQQLGTELTTTPLKLPLTLNSDKLDSNGQMRLADLNSITRGQWSITVPNVIIDLVKSTTEAVSLAQPQMRITEGEKGSLVIGQKTPVPVTSFNTSQTVGGNIVPITSYQYQDVGIKITVEPRVHHNREVTLKVNVEVSQVNSTTDSGQPVIGTRTIDTVIRLQDGETNMLVGLYKEDRSSSKTKIPFLSDIPLLGRLFTNDSRNRSVVDLVMTLTPHIIRYPDIREADLAPLWVGTEKRISYYGNSPRVRSGSGVPGPFDIQQKRLGIAPNRNMQRRLPGTATRSRRVTPSRTNRGAPGTSLVPSGGPSTSKSMTSTLDTSGDSVAAQDATSQDGGGSTDTVTTEDTAGDSQTVAADEGDQQQPMPLLVSLEPSAVSLRPGDESTLRLMLDSNGGTFRMPLTLSYDSERVQLEDVSVAPGVIEVGRNWNHQDGFITLDLIVTAQDPGSRPLATLHLRGLSPGSAPLGLSSDGAVSGKGDHLNVGVTDGAAYVLGDRLTVGGGS